MKKSGIVFGVLLVAGMFGLIFVWEHISDYYLGAPLDKALVTSQGLLGVVGVRHSGKTRSHKDFRLTLLDAASGQRRARRVLGRGEPTCAELQVGHLFCRSRDGLQVLRLPGLELEADHAALQRLVPGLVGEDGALLAVDGRLLVHTNDGRALLVSAEPLQATPADDATARRAAEARAQGRNGRDAGLSLVAADGERQAVVPRQGAAASSDTYLRASFVVLHHGGEGELDGALVLHRSTLDDGSHRLVTRVASDGRALWTRDFGDARVRFGLLEGANVVLVGSFGDGAAVALDAATGAERWHTKF